eukprot:5972706-Pleurochrysis_carterae.AAC.2
MSCSLQWAQCAQGFHKVGRLLWHVLHRQNLPCHRNFLTLSVQRPPATSASARTSAGLGSPCDFIESGLVRSLSIVSFDQQNWS